MSLGGFGVAYDAAVRTLRAQEQLSARHAAHHDRRQKHYDQLLSHHLQHGREAALIQSIEAQLVTTSPRISDRLCPECGEHFVLIDANGVVIDACISCGSFWFDKGELRALTHRAADIQTQEGALRPSRFKCPECGMGMQQHRFLLRHDLLVDRCPNDHGFYLERNELVRSLEIR